MFFYLAIDSNVQYVEQGDTDEVELEFYLTTPFASGREKRFFFNLFELYYLGAAFADSVLDCILSCVS